MSRRRIFQLLSILLAVSLFLVACGDTDTPSDVTTTVDSNGEATTAPSEERVTLEATINTNALTKDINTIGHLQEMADLANVEVIWDQISTDWGERKSVMLASGEVPDMFIGVFTINQGDLAQFPNLFLDMTDLIQEHAPNVQQMFLEKPEIKYLSTTLDGKILALPRYQGGLWPQNTVRTFINMTWLERLDLEVPTNRDELMDVLIAFKTQDPRGTNTDDEIPMDWPSGMNPFHVLTLLAPAGIPMAAMAAQDKGYYMVDGQVNNFFISEEYKELVKWLAEAQANDLINPEVFTQDFTTYQAVARHDGETGIIGFTFGWDLTNRFGSGPVHQEYATIPPIKPSADYDGTVYYENNFLQLNYGSTGASITTTCEHPEAAMRFIDLYYDSYFGMQALFGSIPGEIQDNGDGTYKVLPPEDETMDPGTWKWTNAVADASPMYIQDEWPLELGTDMKALVAQDEVYQEALARYTEREMWPFVFLKYTEADNVELANLNTDIDSITHPQFANWVTNGDPAAVDADWDNYVQGVRSAGLERAIEIVQGAVDRYLDSIE